MAGGHGGEAGFRIGSCPSPVECCIFWVLCYFFFFHMNCEESHGCSIWNWALSFQLRMAQRHLVIIFLDQNVCIRSWQAISCPSALHVARSYPSGTASVGSFYHCSAGTTRLHSCFSEGAAAEVWVAPLPRPSCSSVWLWLSSQKECKQR